MLRRFGALRRVCWLPWLAPWWLRVYSFCKKCFAGGLNFPPALSVRISAYPKSHTCFQTAFYLRGTAVAQHCQNMRMLIWTHLQLALVQARSTGKVWGKAQAILVASRQHVVPLKPTTRSVAAAQDSFPWWWAWSLSTLAHVKKCGKPRRTARACEGHKTMTVLRGGRDRST